MAPEQIGGKEIDARADVYALGCVLYAMLTGRTPFHSRDELHVLYRQVHEPPQPVTRRASHLSVELEAVVMRALQKLPADRWPSMRDFAEALKPFTSPPPRDRPPSLHEQTEVVSRLPPPGRWLRYTALALVALLLVGTGALAAIRLQPTLADTLVLVISDPPGASLVVDGKPIADVTPAALRGLRPGRHQLTLKRAHYGDATRFVQVEAGGRVTVELPLPPQTHSIEIHTIPDGAQLYLDGNLVAHRTPVSVDVTDDEYHQLRIEKEGYQTVLQRLKPEETGALPRIVLEPETNPRATLFVDAEAPAELWLDGEFTGFMTPSLGLRVSAGAHRVELRSPSGTHGEAATVKLSQGETLRVSLKTPKAGR